MEASNGKPLVIEFFGTPGCGKTTTAQQLIFELEKGGIKCVKSYHKSHFYTYKLVQLMAPSNWLLLFRLIVLAIKQNSFFDTLPGILAICHSRQMYKMFAASIGVGNRAMVLGQAIFQGFLSMSHREKMCSVNLLPRVLSSIKKNDYRYVVVYCRISPSESMKRIRGRKLQNGRLDSMDDMQLLHTLEIQNENAEMIYNYIQKNTNVDIIEINTAESVLVNAAKIIDHLCSND